MADSKQRLDLSINTGISHGTAGVHSAAECIGHSECQATASAGALQVSRGSFQVPS